MKSFLNKNKKYFYSLGIIILVFLPIYSVYAVLSCTVTTSALCSSGTVVLRMSGSDNAHAELPSQSTSAYNNNVVCCTGISGLSNSCVGNHEVVARLSGVTNAHVEKNSETGVNYTENACLSSIAGDIITIGYQPTNCVGYDTTLFSMENSLTNSQVGIPTSYNNKVCAKIVSQSLTFSVSSPSAGFGSLTPLGLRYATSDGIGSSADVASYTLQVSTNAPSGYIMVLQGNTLSNGVEDITPIGETPTIPSPGSEAFGMRVESSGGSGVVVSPYNQAGFAYDATGSTFTTVAEANSGDGQVTTYSVHSVATIDSLLDPGTYSTNLIYVVTGNF